MGPGPLLGVRRGKDRGFGPRLGSPIPFPRTRTPRQRCWGREGSRARESLPAPAPADPRRLHCALKFCASGLAADPSGPRPKEREPIGSAPVSGRIGIGEQGPCAEDGKEDIARSGVSPRLNRVVFRGAQARSVSAPRRSPLPYPGPARARRRRPPRACGPPLRDLFNIHGR